MLPDNNWIFVQVTDVCASDPLGVLLHDHPAELSLMSAFVKVRQAQLVGLRESRGGPFERNMDLSRCCEARSQQEIQRLRRKEVKAVLRAAHSVYR